MTDKNNSNTELSELRDRIQNAFESSQQTLELAIQLKESYHARYLQGKEENAQLKEDYAQQSQYVSELKEELKQKEEQLAQSMHNFKILTRNANGFYRDIAEIINDPENDPKTSLKEINHLYSNNYQEYEQIIDSLPKDQRLELNKSKNNLLYSNLKRKAKSLAVILGGLMILGGSFLGYNDYVPSCEKIRKAFSEQSDSAHTLPKKESSKKEVIENKELDKIVDEKILFSFESEKPLFSLEEINFSSEDNNFDETLHDVDNSLDSKIKKKSEKKIEAKPKKSKRGYKPVSIANQPVNFSLEADQLYEIVPKTKKTFDLNDIFNDPDGDDLEFSIKQNNQHLSSYFKTRLNKNKLTINPIKEYSSPNYITITIRESRNEKLLETTQKKLRFSRTNLPNWKFKTKDESIETAVEKETSNILKEKEEIQQKEKKPSTLELLPKYSPTPEGEERKEEQMKKIGI